MSDANTIVLKVNGRRGEGKLDAIAYPGMSLSLAADGEYDLCICATGERCETLIAVEDGLQGKLVTDAYAINDVASFVQPIAGDEVQVLLKDGETVVIGGKLIKETNSGLYLATTGTVEEEPFTALEALSPSGANGLIRVRKS